MKVLVVGGGGREHALCWKLRQSPLLTDLYCAPGNPGIAELADTVPIASDEIQRLVDFAEEMRIDLTVVGPELPLTLGLVDEMRSRGLAVFGPTRQAAELEGSKVFAKELMARHGIPTAPFEVAYDVEEARRKAASMGLPLVVKCDGLASGKGVLICRDRDEVEEALQSVFEEKRFGASGEKVVLEAFLEGEEVSFIALCADQAVLPLATSKDYKRIGDGDSGPNTGGMGAHSPSGVLQKETASEVLDKVLRAAVRGMAEENRPFTGFLYAGLMLTAEGPRVLEFNVRLGDPEAQVLMLRIEEDLLPILASGARGSFETPRLTFKKESAVCVVLASPGYPSRPQTGAVIEGLDEARAMEGVEIFHAGTALRQGNLVTAGGRVLNVCATAPKLVDALRKAYSAAASIEWPGKQMRRDIGRRVLERS